MELLQYAPFFALAFVIIEGLISPWRSEKVKNLQAHLEVDSKEELSNNMVDMYDDIIYGLNQQIKSNDLPADMEKEEVEALISELVYEREETKEDSSKMEDRIRKMIHKRVTLGAVNNTVSRLLLNTGFILLPLAGYWMGIILTAITFVGSAMLIQSTLTEDERLVEYYRNPELVAIGSALALSAFYHMPFLLAIFVW